MFRRGQRVTPIHNDLADLKEAGLEWGGAYTVIGHCSRALHVSGVPGVFFGEARVPQTTLVHCRCYTEDAFRPLVTTDISIFEQMLVDPPKQLIREDV